MVLRLVPVTLEQAKRFIGEHHRHNMPPKRYRFAVGVEEDGHLVGVGACSQPVARLLDDGKTVEVVRTCTDGTMNANSMLYGSLARAAKALGFSRMYTYTLATETGASLKASGWSIDADNLKPQTWNRPNRYRPDVDMFGSRLPPEVPRIRWVKHLYGQ